ncbi:hypothetical protein pb186bvf_004369 [Paramecium bursaria]
MLNRSSFSLKIIKIDLQFYQGIIIRHMQATQKPLIFLIFHFGLSINKNKKI